MQMKKFVQFCLVTVRLLAITSLDVCESADSKL